LIHLQLFSFPDVFSVENSLEHSHFLTEGVRFSYWETACGFQCPRRNGKLWCASVVLAVLDISVRHNVPVS